MATQTPQPRYPMKLVASAVGSTAIEPTVAVISPAEPANAGSTLACGLRCLQKVAQ